ncbi:MAG: hypothetical protein IPF73_04145 [Betaproteobacteria bacterium]|nr:hypothetical protein [Betaproteobacteria bacterium]
MSIIDTATNSVLATVPVGNGPRSPVANSGLGKVYVPNYNDASVSVIDTVTRTVRRRSPVGSGPMAVDAAAGLRHNVGAGHLRHRLRDGFGDQTLPSGAGATTSALSTTRTAATTSPTASTIRSRSSTPPRSGDGPGRTKPSRSSDLNGGNVYVVTRAAIRSACSMQRQAS